MVRLPWQTFLRAALPITENRSASLDAGLRMCKVRLGLLGVDLTAKEQARKAGVKSATVQHNKRRRQIWQQTRLRMRSQ